MIGLIGRLCCLYRRGDIERDNLDLITHDIQPDRYAFGTFPIGAAGTAKSMSSIMLPVLPSCRSSADVGGVDSDRDLAPLYTRPRVGPSILRRIPRFPIGDLLDGRFIADDCRSIFGTTETIGTSHQSPRQLRAAFASIVDLVLTIRPRVSQDREFILKHGLQVGPELDVDHLLD